MSTDSGVGARTADGAEVVRTSRCRSCGELFGTSVDEMDRLHKLAASLGWRAVAPPARCWACRRRIRREAR